MKVVVTSFFKKNLLFLTQNKENIRCFFKKQSFLTIRLKKNYILNHKYESNCKFSKRAYVFFLHDVGKFEKNLLLFIKL